MATSTTTKQEPLGRVDEDEMQHGQLVDCFCQHLVDHHDDHDAMEEVSGNKRGVSRLAVEGGGAAGGSVVVRSPATPGDEDAPALRDRRLSGIGGRTMPPPHAWLAIEDTARTKQHEGSSDPEEQWLRLLQGGGGGGAANNRLQQRRSSFSVVRRERAAREAWLDRAWEMKRSWHQRNGGAPDADTPVVVVVGNSSNGRDHHQSSASSPDHAPGAGGVAMDVEEVRACRDLGLELPSDCTVEIQCFGLDGGSPTHTAGNSSGADSPSSGAGVSSPGTKKSFFFSLTKVRFISA